MKWTKQDFEQKFVCPKCRGRGALVQEVQIGRAVARIVPLPASSYLSVSCSLCGYTEFYNLALVAREEALAPSAGAQPAQE